ncbi:MAG: alpha-N-arabinofuranosidase [Pirellulales bacterium]
MSRCYLGIALRLAALVFLFPASPFHSRAADVLEAQAVVHGEEDGGMISRHLYGHFTEHLGRCIYDGIWVGEESPIPNTRGMRTDILDALKAIKIPNLRWPGGCYADDYHWRNGIGPRADRPSTINMNWGQVTDTNAFGTHEFLDLCETLGCEPYIAGNVGSGSPEEMRDWIEYMTFDGDSALANLRRQNGRDRPWKVKYFGVGNENWGCGGNMRPEYYADVFRRYSTFCRDFSGNQLTRVACGPGGRDTHWTDVLLDRAHEQMQAYSLHFYTVWPNWENKTPATGFGEREWFEMLRESRVIEQAIDETVAIMDRHDPRKKIELYADEWGAWYRGEEGHPGYALYQQNSLRDALLAGITFHIFHEHNDRLKMANIAQVVNVLQALILTDDEKMVLTPTYWLFDLYKVHQDSTRLPLRLVSPDYEFDGKKFPALSASASRDKQGVVHISLVNAHATSAVKLGCELKGVVATSVAGRILTANSLDAHNTFDSPNDVKPADFNGARIDGGKLTAEIPAHSVLMLTLK